MKTGRLLIWVAALSLLIASLAPAATINYPDKTGITMRFFELQEYSGTDPVPLYGAPTLSGDSLVFTSMTFNSFSQNGASDLTDGQFNGKIESKNNDKFYINKIRFQEFGDVTLTGTGTAATNASVANSLIITVLEVDDSSMGFPVYIPVNMVMSQNGDWNLADDGSISAKIWSGVVEVDVTAALIANGITGHATEVSFSMDNVLATESELNTSASISKKVNGLTVTPIVVPEPLTMSLLGLGGLALLRRRKA